MSEENEKKKTFCNCCGYRILLTVTATGSLSGLAAGAVLGWALGPHPALAARAPPALGTYALARRALLVHAGLVAGAAAAAVYSAALADRLGRRRLLAWAAALCSAFWTGHLLVQGAFALGAGAGEEAGPRLWSAGLLAALGGHALGVVLVVLPLYLGEVAPPALRGALGGSVGLALALGALLQALLSLLLPAPLHFALQALVPGALAATAAWAGALPPSPAWLAARGRDREALFALMALRPLSDSAAVHAELADKQVSAWPVAEFREPCLDLFGRTGTRKELEPPVAVLVEPIKMQEEVCFKEETDALAPDCDGVATASIKLEDGFNVPAYYCLYQALSAVLAVLFLNQVGSFVALPFLAGGLFTGDPKALQAQAEWLAAQAAGAALSVLLVDAMGRRALLGASGLGVALTAACLGTVAIEEGVPMLEGPADWRARCYVCGYAASLGLGLWPLPWTLLGDLFAAHARAHAGTVALLLWSALHAAAPDVRLLLAAAAPPRLAAALAYGASAAAGALACCYAVFVLPEGARRNLSALLRELDARRGARRGAGPRGKDLQLRTQSLPTHSPPPPQQAQLPPPSLLDLVASDTRGCCLGADPSGPFAPGAGGVTF